MKIICGQRPRRSLHILSTLIRMIISGSFEEFVIFAASSHDSFDYFNKDYCLNIKEHKGNSIVLRDLQAAQLWLAISQEYPNI